MSVLEIILLTALVVSNWIWYTVFSGYRKGVREAIKEHRIKEHGSDE